MYLKERIISLLLFYGILFIVTFFISSAKDIKKTKRILVIYVILLGIMAYFYVPSETSDLSRHFYSLKFYSEMPLNDFISFILKKSSPLSIIYLRIIGKLGNEHLLPCITSTIHYSILFKMYMDFIKKYEIKSKYMALGFIILMISGKFLGLISGIRNGLAFIFAEYAIYIDFFKNEKISKTAYLYIIAALIHTAAIIPFILRIIYYMFEKNKNLLAKVKDIIIISIFILLFMKYGNFIVEEAIGKGAYYLYQQNYFYIWEHLIAILYLIFICFTIIMFNKKIKDTAVYNYGKFILLIELICFSVIYEHSLFTRIQGLASTLFMFYFAYILNYLKCSNRNLKIYSFITYMTIISIFIISITRGNICGLKFFILFNAM